MIWNLIVALSAGLLVDKVGRRKLFITSTLGATSLGSFFLLLLILSIGMLLFWTLQTICFSLVAQHGWKSAGHAVIAFICKSIFYIFGL
jgi:MFS family permease